MDEVWKDIEGYEGIYQVSNLGKVKSLKYNKERILKPSLNSTKRYLTVVLCNLNGNSTKSVHKIVANTFIENSNKYSIVNHINKISTDNRVENLEHCTQQHNVDHSCSKKVYQFDLDKNLVNEWKSAKEAERSLNNVKNQLISRNCNEGSKTHAGFIWSHKKELS